MFTYGQPIERGGSGADCKLGDLIYCQRLKSSASGRTAAYHVITRRRYLFLYISQHKFCRASTGFQYVSVSLSGSLSPYGSVCKVLLLHTHLCTPVGNGRGQPGLRSKSTGCIHSQTAEFHFCRAYVWNLPFAVCDNSPPHH